MKLLYLETEKSTNTILGNILLVHNTIIIIFNILFERLVSYSKILLEYFVFQQQL